MARDTFDYAKGRTIIGKFVADMDLHELTWAWAVTVDCIDIIGHHATPATEVRGPYRADMWFDWYGSFLFGADANHCIHGLAKEVRDACPPQLYPALLASVERAFAACAARTRARIRTFPTGPRIMCGPSHEETSTCLLKKRGLRRAGRPVAICGRWCRFC